MSSLNLGGHLSLGRKPEATVQQAAHDGFQSMQIFASSPGAWRPPKPDAEAARRFREARHRYGVNPLVIHAIYLINLASADPDLVARSAGSLKATLDAGQAMGASAVVTHIGSHSGRGFDAVAGQIATGIREVLGQTEGGPLLLLENSAGAGAIVGSDLAELAELIERAGGDPRLGIALDTAHLAGAGWDFQDPNSASRLADDADRLIGLDRLSVIHANDSAVPVGSRKDRHANIGEGSIGDEGFRHLLAEKRLRQVPWIMETPDLGERETGTATGSLIRLRELAGECGGGE
jgi:deoxyribonuclease-4